jgi:hypothetical protein
VEVTGGHKTRQDKSPSTNRNHYNRVVAMGRHGCTNLADIFRHEKEEEKKKTTTTITTTTYHGW